MGPEELIHEARATAAAAGIGGSRPADEAGAEQYFCRVRDLAQGLVVSAGGDEALLDRAWQLALGEDGAEGGAKYMSGATRALGVAAALAVPPEMAALQAAVLAEAHSTGSPEGLADRRLQAVADLTRWDPEVLVEAAELLPTGIVTLDDVPAAVAAARDILTRAREALGGLGR